MKGDKLAEWELANPFDEDDYKYPTADMLKQLLVNRLEHSD